MSTTTADALHKIIQSGQVPTPMLFYGPKGSQKKQAAIEFLGRFIAHPCDLIHYVPEGKNHIHTIQSMKVFTQSIHMPPFQGKYRGFIIEDADHLTEESGNAILKALEEAPKYCLIILLAEDDKRLLPTISSRLVKFPFHAVEENAYLDLHALDHLEKKSYTEKLEIFETIEQEIAKDPLKKRQLIEALAQRLPPQKALQLEMFSMAVQHHVRLSTSLFFLFSD